MGGWFLSVANGNNLSGLFASEVSGETGMTVASALSGYTFGFWSLVGSGVVLFLVSPLINKLKAPVLVVWGHQDRVVPWEGALSALAGIPDVRIHIWGGGTGQPDFQLLVRRSHRGQTERLAYRHP